MRKGFFARLAVVNIRKNKQIYVPYILACLFNVAMLYMMLFINHNAGMKTIRHSGDVLMITTMGVGVIVIFSFIFLLYSNSFLMKRRQKELGLYNILGLEKKHISRVMMLENLFSALISFVGGILVGILGSKLALLLLLKLIKVPASFGFEVSVPAIRICLEVFGAIFVLILLVNIRKVYKTNPIQLLQAQNAGEKEPKAKWLMAVAGFICLFIGYYIAITTESPLSALALFFVAVVLVMAGTYLLFTAGSIVVLKVLRWNKKFYYKTKNFTAVSGMLYRMKQNAAGLASICVLSTMVLVMISMTVSMFAGVDDELKACYPYEVNYMDRSETMDPTVDVQELYQKMADTIQAQGREITDSEVYSYFQIFMTVKGSEFLPLDGSVDVSATDMTGVTFITRESLLASDRSLKASEMPEPEAGKVNIYSKTPYNQSTIQLYGQTYAVDQTFSYESENDSFMVLDDSIYVVADESVLRQIFDLQKAAGMNADGSSMLSMYQTEISFEYDGTKEEKLACAEALSKAMESGENTHTSYLESRTENEKDFYVLYGGLFFLGLFLGIMFLMVTVMIIFYKQISEGYDDRERYIIMEKVGMSHAEVKATIQSQIRIVFFLPLVMAAIHVAAAFPMIRRLLAMLNLTNVPLFVTCLVVTILIFTAIYYLVFRITSKAYDKIVSK